MSRGPQAPYSLPQPIDAEDARIRGRELAERRRNARKEFEDNLVAAADAKREHRKALAIAHVSAQGDNAAARKADAESRASEAEHAREIAEGMVKVAQEKLAEVDGDRATFHRLCEWSMKLDPFATEDRTPPERAAR